MTEVFQELDTMQATIERINSGTEESTEGLASSSSVYKALFVMTLFLLFTGKYEE
jgi:hypothetical protein